ncbi:MAG: hypothetical protein HZA69_07660 [Gammaproteobacteria bacterium]|nr:hypothetical protein [Gammaproteobacteria bacterium]
MSCIDPLLIITAHEKYQRRLRLSRQVADGIMLCLHINAHGREFLPLIGKSGELNNGEAMRAWVERELGGTQAGNVTQLTEQLTGRFVSLMVEFGCCLS